MNLSLPKRIEAPVAYDKNLAASVRHALSDIRELREQKMMGALCFMVTGKMCYGVNGDSLMIRVGPQAYDVFLAKDQVRPMEISSRRKLRGFVLVDQPVIATDEALNFWIAVGTDFVATLPA